MIGYFTQGVKTARDGWRDDPTGMAIKALLALAAGQAVYWSLGYDQLSLLMGPRREMGFGRRVAERIYERLPKTARVAWLIKALEIAGDLSKMPVERRVLQRRGFVADVVGTLITQPLWSGVEASEKLAGALLHPDRVPTAPEVKASLGCIYGTAVRLSADLMIWRYGRRLYALCRRRAAAV